MIIFDGDDDVDFDYNAVQVMSGSSSYRFGLD